jgi:hypothetical protein
VSAFAYQETASADKIAAFSYKKTPSPYKIVASSVCRATIPALLSDRGLLFELE